MIDAGVEINILQQMLVERRLLHLLRQTAVAAPVERYRAAAMRDYEFQAREILEQVALDKLHERGGVGVDIMRSGMMEIRIAGRRYMNHRRHFEFAQFLVDWVPMPVGQRRIGPITAGGVRIEV